MDDSNLDKKYFINPYKYNCPYCKRNHVSYELSWMFSFNWTNDKTCYAYIVKCHSCQNISLHFSFEDCRQDDPDEIRKIAIIGSSLKGPIKKINVFKDDIDIDSKIFFSQPSSSFTIDSRINKKIRELLSESEQCRQSNFLTGSSACLRKAIYEILLLENVIIKNKQGKTNYQESIKNLKEKFPKVNPELFNFLGEIQELTCDLVHEESWESWDSKHLKFLLELSKTVLYEMYVLPEEEKKKMKEIVELKKGILSKKKNN